MVGSEYRGLGTMWPDGTIKRWEPRGNQIRFFKNKLQKNVRRVVL